MYTQNIGNKFNKYVENKLFGEVIENLEEFMRNKKKEIVFDRIKKHFGKKIKIDRKSSQYDYYVSKIYFSEKLMILLQYKPI